MFGCFSLSPKILYLCMFWWLLLSYPVRFMDFFARFLFLCNHLCTAYYTIVNFTKFKGKINHRGRGSYYYITYVYVCVCVLRDARNYVSFLLSRKAVTVNVSCCHAAHWKNYYLSVSVCVLREYYFAKKSFVQNIRIQFYQRCTWSGNLLKTSSHCCLHNTALSRSSRMVPFERMHFEKNFPLILYRRGESWPFCWSRLPLYSRIALILIVDRVRANSNLY
jgi:hypothetical protein